MSIGRDEFRSLARSHSALESLQAAIGQWVGERELKAMLERRDRMRGDFEKLMKANPDALIK